MARWDTSWLCSEAVVWRSSVKKVLLKISQIHRKRSVLESLFNKVLLKNFIKKETQAQVFSCEFSKFFKITIIKNNLGNYHKPATLSKKDSNTGLFLRILWNFFKNSSFSLEEKPILRFLKFTMYNQESITFCSYPFIYFL